jgi:hypothetical protein
LERGASLRRVLLFLMPKLTTSPLHQSDCLACCVNHVCEVYLDDQMADFGQCYVANSV